MNNQVLNKKLESQVYNSFRNNFMKILIKLNNPQNLSLIPHLINEFIITYEYHLRTFTGKKLVKNICTTEQISIQIVQVLDNYFPCALYLIWHLSRLLLLFSFWVMYLMCKCCEGRSIDVMDVARTMNWNWFLAAFAIENQFNTKTLFKYSIFECSNSFSDSFIKFQCHHILTTSNNQQQYQSTCERPLFNDLLFSRHWNGFFWI